MKNRLIVSTFMALAMLCSCVPDHRDFNMPDSAVYFTDNTANNGVQQVLLYDVQSEVETPVYVYCAGLNAGTSNVKAHVTEDYIEYYNKINYTEFKALPEDCYTLKKSSDEINGRTASFTVSFNVPNIIAFTEDNDVDISDYVLALELESDNIPVASVKDTTSLGYYMVSPNLKNATLQIKSAGLTPDGKMTITAELPFENSWELTYDVEFATADVDELFTTRGNTIPAKYVFADKFPEGTVIENKDVKSMSAGTNTVEYNITIPADGLVWAPGKTFNYAVRFSNAVLNGKEIPIENPLLTCSVNAGIDIKASNGSTELGTRLAGHGLTPLDDKQGGGRTGDFLETIVPGGGFIFHAQTAQDKRPGADYSISGVFDKNVTNTERSWMQNWGWNGDNGYGATSFSTPYWLLVDMQEKFNMGGVEFWTRSDGRYNMKAVEIYALDDCTYTLNQSILNYESSDVTYIGRLDFTSGAQNVSVSVDPVKTRYIMLNIINAGGGLDCQELVLWGY
ncbi:MAG: DUF1735 domain-containing protein [Bacteroidales bacterium]|nr:DUF1735 domain-containing protein [Bacteroidales bacterium]